MLKKIKFFVAIVILTFFFLGLMVLVYITRNNNFYQKSDPHITEIKVCEGPNNNSQCDKVFQNRLKELYVCGHIESNHVNIKNLTVILYKEGVKKPVYASPVGDQFNTGYFCRKVVLPHYNQNGSYRVDIYYFRVIITTTKFQIH